MIFTLEYIKFFKNLLNFNQTRKETLDTPFDAILQILFMGDQPLNIHSMKNCIKNEEYME